MAKLNMTEAQYILADLVLLNIPVNTEFRTPGPMNSISMGELQGKYSPEICYEIGQTIANRNSIIRDFLKQEKYIRTITPSTHLDILTDKGEIAQQQGGHKQYLEWEERQNNAKKEEMNKSQNLHIHGNVIDSQLSQSLESTDFSPTFMPKKQEPTHIKETKSISNTVLLIIIGVASLLAWWAIKKFILHTTD